MKLFNRYDVNIKIEDPGLRNYINLEPRIIPRTGGRNVSVQFWKSKTHIVERLMNKLMVPGHRGKKHKKNSGHLTGKGQHVYKVVENALKIIEGKTNKNPVEVLVKAIENAAPREEITTIEYGGAKYPQAVECSPQRRVDITLRQFVVGAYDGAFGKKKKIEESLADEILKAYENDKTSSAISKKFELERQADASR